MKTYSFLDVNAAIVGPGGSFSLGSGAGIADEGISIEPSGEISGMAIGADGQGFHSLKADKSGRITVRVLKTSPVNGLLSSMLAFQRTSASNHGQNTITVANPSQGDMITCQQVAFSKVPVVSYGKEGGMNEWTFDAITIDVGLGAAS
jgi:hypothetical protein